MFDTQKLVLFKTDNLKKNYFSRYTGRVKTGLAQNIQGAE